MDVAIVSAVLAVIVVALGLWVASRRRAARRAAAEEAAIPLVFPLRGDDAVPGRPTRERRPSPPPGVPRVTPVEGRMHSAAPANGSTAPYLHTVAASEPAHAVPTIDPDSTPTSPPTTAPTAAPAPVASVSALAPERSPRDLVARQHIPADGTLQFLPGRLEILAGRDDGREIRFVRTGGPDGSIVTFGRAEGPPYRHVQLFEPTVSRNHARMRFDGSSWHLTNLSATNPVVLNGEELPADGAPRPLRDGDRIEMGEVTFRFHVR